MVGNNVKVELGMDNTPKFNKKLEFCTFNLPRQLLDNAEDPYGTIAHPV